MRCLLQTVGVAGLGLSLMYMLQEKLVRSNARCQMISHAAQSTRCTPWMNITLGTSSSTLSMALLCVLTTCSLAQIYVPRIPGVSNEFAYLPEQFGFAFEDVWLTAADGIKLHAWFMWPREWAEGVLATKPTVLFLQVLGQ